MHRLPISTLSVRTQKALAAIGANTYEALAKKTARELLKIKGFWRKSLKEVVAILAKEGHSLSAPPITPTPTRPLTSDEREVLRLRGNLMSYVRIGIKLNLSPTRVVQIEKSAMKKRRKDGMQT